jgi:osmotically-inducible protein OsmY
MAEHWDRDRDRERGRRYRGEGYYGGYYGYPERDYGRRGDDRGFFDRAGDEVRSWFGDEDAQRRRMRDDRAEGPSWADRDWWPGRERERNADERRSGGWRESDDVDRDWARQWGYVDRGEMRRPERGSPRGWGYSGGYGAGAGFMGRSDWSGSGGYEPTGWTGQERYGSRPAVGQTSGFGQTRYDAERYRTMSGPHVGRGPRGYQRSDERIREDVCERMAQCGDLDATDIEVRVSNAEVTLVGVVQDRQDKRLAEDLVEQVSGVREVHNQIRVNQGSGQDAQPQQPQRQQPNDQQRYRIA